MKKAFKLGLVVLIVFAVVPLMGFGAAKVAGGGGKRSKLEKIAEVEKGVELARKAYKLCDDSEAVIILSQIGIIALSKKEGRDPSDELGSVLEKIHKPQLRNLTRFLMAGVAVDMNKDNERAVEILRSIIDENTDLEAAVYHAGMSRADRTRVQDQFKAGEVHIVCATCAFGMGIDIPNIRTIVHLGPPG